MSLVVLLVTGYGWSNYRHLLNGLATSDVAEGGGADGAVDILLVGMDSRTDAHGNPLPENVLRELHAGSNEGSLTDTVIMLHIPNDGTSAVGFSFPRDSYVSIPGQGNHKINSAYGRGKEAEVVSQQQRGVSDPAALERAGNDAGRKLLLRTVENLTGTSIDHYAEVNLLGFAKITESVGGVPVCLNSDTSDTYSGADFKAGPQSIAGPDALAFVRQRHGLPRGDLDRVVRQQAFLAGLAQTALSGGVLANPNKLRDLINSVQDSVVLDLGDDSDVLDFAERLRGLAAGAIKFNTIPIEDAAYDTPDGEALKVNPRDVKEAVRAASQPPGAPSSPAAQPPPTSASQEAVATRVDVLNGTRTSGLASKVQDQLSGQGIEVGTVGNTSKRSSSVVRYGPGADAAGQEVASLLGGMPTESDSSLSSGRVQVIIGSDYDGPSGPRFSPGGALALDGSARQQDPEVPSQDSISAAGIPCVN
ncbi:LCP family protein [Saccharopolyspora mangrovi]|uniref:LCP family protein n=1 Tax=Saccharopolyspora mangrovi TaxID=3082379 RepID=A0ABU6AEI5_9PSEU|nr:LCP family protein [Saccharopolyspora sp. S2-29]MEB3369956.1 LCP family protein [Saccharopolyspora sp. S2-29]